MLSASILDAMVASGCTAQQIAEVVKAALAVEEEKRQEKRSKDAERQRRHRMSRDVTVTNSDTPSPLDPPLMVSPKPPSYNPPYNPPIPSLSVGAQEAFEEFRRAYPKRRGSNPWKPAREKFMAALKRGEDPEAILAGARAYARAEAGGDPQYVAQAVTWLNQERWKDPIEQPSNVKQFPKPDDGKARFRDALSKFTGRAAEPEDAGALDGEYQIIGGP